MSNKRNDLDRWVFQFTTPTYMKFQPVQDFQQPQQNKKSGYLSRIRNFFSPPSRPTVEKDPMKKTPSMAAHLMNGRKQSNKPVIKFSKRLTQQHVLVGNEDQLDAMCISGIVNDFVDTQFLWTLKIRKAIVKVAIDCKRNYIILLSENDVSAFSFQPKNMRLKPEKVGSVPLFTVTKHINVLRQGMFSLCYNWGVQVFVIDETKGIRQTLKKKFTFDNAQKMRLLQVPEPFENILNIFFQEVNDEDASFTLWNIQMEFYQKQIKISKPQHVYKIAGFSRSTIRMENYSKTIFLVNMGADILAFRKGYNIDTASVSMGAGSNYLRYLQGNKLVHVTDTKTQVYHFSVNQAVHPPRIIVESTDSIQIPSMRKQYQFISIVEMAAQNFVVFYQLKPEENKLLKGETKYAFLVTKTLKMEDKLRYVLPQSNVDKVQIANIEEKADMAKKMGLQRKQIYLRLWSNSNKTSVQDFQLLLDTLDYDTIKAEIQKKLKKSSMNYREVQLLEQGCNVMLHANVFGPNNTVEDIKNYFISDLLIRKLNLYKLLILQDKKQGKAISEDPTGKLLINIQNYNYFRTVDIKTLLFQYINRFVNEDKNEVTKIRLIIRQFKFSLRIVYQDLISDIITTVKKNFLKLLKAIPEFLPYEPQYDPFSIEDPATLAGVWRNITDQEWDHFHINNIEKIQNTDNLKELVNSVWFKRHWLTQHDYVNKNRQQIQQIQNRNASEQTFYKAIEKIFQFHDYTSIRDTIDFIQDRYQKMPQHIYGKVFLYKELYDHFKANRHINRIDEIESFDLFLKLKDPELFKAMFNFEKVKKGFILKEIKPIYQKLSCIQVFNEGLLHYFASDQCAISDIKYILNRLNNEKQQFHEENKGIYEVLVRGMQLKMKLGSEKDIPMEQVLIYIENIPLLGHSSLGVDLKLMKQIKAYQKKFSEMKINMTIFQIIRNMDKVISAIIHYEVNQKEIYKVNDITLLKLKTKNVIQEVQQIKKKLYPSQGQPELTLFTFLSDMMQEQQGIGKVIILLEDQWINQYFSITKLLIQNLVMFNYNKRMRIHPSFEESVPYLQQLSTLLEPQSIFRQYMQAEIEVATILMSSQVPLMYPLSCQNSYFTSSELLNLIQMMSGPKLCEIDIPKLFQNMLKMQQLSSDNQFEQITLNSIYQMIIIRMIECCMLKQSIPKIRQLIALQEQSSYNFIFIALLLEKIVPEMIEENRNLILKCSSHLFSQPLQLLDILEQIMTVNATSSQYKKLIIEHYETFKDKHLTYQVSSQVIQPRIIDMLETDELKQNFQVLLRYSRYNLLSQKLSFSQPEYYLMYTMLINDPYVLVKYVHVRRATLNLKHIRCFLSYLIKQDLFSKNNVLELGKRLCFIIFKSVVRNRRVEELIDTFKNVPLTQNIEIQKILVVKSEMQKKFAYSVDRFKQKLKTVLNAIRKRKEQGSSYEQTKIQNIKKRLEKPRTKQGRYQYPFADSDDAAHQEEGKGQRQLAPKSSILQTFDSQFQRQSLIKRKNEVLDEYLSIRNQKKKKEQFYSEKANRDSMYGDLVVDKGLQNNIVTFTDQSLKDLYEPTPPPKKQRIGAIDSLKSIQSKLKQNPLKILQRKTSRSQAINQITSQERLVIQKQQEELVLSRQASIVGKSMDEAAILISIIKPGMVITDDTQFDFQPLQSHQNNRAFKQLLKEMVIIAYKNEGVTFRGVLIFIKKMNLKFPDLKINKQWINIYLRAEGLQNKFNLQLPLKQLFTASGLFVQSQIPQNLFHFLFPTIMKKVTNQNIHKLCKVVNLAFKKTDLQQQILFHYLVQILKEYQISVQMADVPAQDLNRQKDKFKGIIHKMPIKYIIERQKQIFKIFPDEKVQKDVAKIFIDSFVSRSDIKAADYLSEKYISKVPNPRKR